MKLASSTGMLLLGVWLILFGVPPLLNFNFPAHGTVLNVLGIATGIMILMNK